MLNASNTVATVHTVTTQVFMCASCQNRTVAHDMQVCAVLL